MAKLSYKWPSSLARSVLDFEIRPWGERSVPVRQIFYFLGGSLFIAFLVMKTPLGHSGALFTVLFIMWAVAALFYFGRLTPAKELTAQQVPALLNYLPRSSRQVYTRRDSDAGDFFSICGISGITRGGQIEFTDGSVGQGYIVVGSASYLLFDRDRLATLDRVDSFWRKVDTTCEWIWLTTKESQRVHHQLASLERRNVALEHRDPDLLELQNEQYDILVGHVGGKFSSLHQYLVLKAKTAEALRRAHQVLEAEVESSSLMLKEVTMLSGAEMLAVFALFYRADGNQPVVSTLGKAA